MGYYIEVPEHHNKARQLIQLHGAEPLEFHPPRLADIPADKVLICVVYNGLFDACGIAFSEEEMQVFANPDGRPKTWLLMDKAKVLELNPAARRVLE